MSNICWDLDGLISKADFKDLDYYFNLLDDLSFDESYDYLMTLTGDERELFKQCASLSYSENPFSLHIDRLMNVFKTTEKYNRYLALGLSDIEFTTNSDIFNYMGLFYISLNDDKFIFEGSSNILLYFNRQITQLNSFLSNNFKIRINSLGNRVIDGDWERDMESLIYKIYNNDYFNIEFENVTKEEVLKHFGVIK